MINNQLAQIAFGGFLATSIRSLSSIGLFPRAFQEETLVSDEAVELGVSLEMITRLIEPLSDVGLVSLERNGKLSLGAQFDNMSREEIEEFSETCSFFASAEYLGLSTKYLDTTSDRLNLNDIYSEIAQDESKKKLIFNQISSFSSTLNSRLTDFLVDHFSGVSALDIGTGDGDLAVRLWNTGKFKKVCALDKYSKAQAIHRIKNRAIDFIEADFFKYDFNGFDLYILKFICQDWPDEQVKFLLKNVSKKLSPGETLLIFEACEVGDIEINKWRNITRGLYSQGRERNTDEFRELIAECELKVSWIEHFDFGGIFRLAGYCVSR